MMETRAPRFELVLVESIVQLWRGARLLTRSDARSREHGFRIESLKLALNSFSHKALFGSRKQDVIAHIL